MSNPIFLHDNRFEDTTSLTASTVDPSDTSFNVLNVIDKRPYTIWQSGTSTGEKYITIDTSNATASADAYGITGHNLNGAVIAIQNSSDNFVSVTTVATFTPTNDKTFMSTFSSASNRYWRFAITQPTSVKLRIGVAVIGNKFELTAGEQREINPDSHQTNSIGADSKSLHPLGVTVRGRQRNRKVNLKAVPSTWIRDTFIPQWDSWMHKSEPAFYNWNISIASTASYYMQVVPDNSFESNYLDNTDFRNLSLSLKGLYE